MAQVIKGVFPEPVKTTSENKAQPVPSYILHISITFSDPLIWRRVQVPGNFTLAGLHNIIQAAMGWSDSHLHQFLVGKISYEPTMKKAKPREAKRFNEANYRIHTLEEGMQFMFSYLYDAGDGWEHVIQLEEVVSATRELKKPILLAGEGACPPEEVCDIHEYHILVGKYEDPENKDNSLAELAGVIDFDPLYFDLEAARKRVGTI